MKASLGAQAIQGLRQHSRAGEGMPSGQEPALLKVRWESRPAAAQHPCGSRDMAGT